MDLITSRKMINVRHAGHFMHFFFKTSVNKCWSFSYSGERKAEGREEEICRTTEIMEQTSRGHGV